MSREVVQAFTPSRKHIRAGDVFVYQVSDGTEYYGLVVKHKFDLGGFKNCLLLYFFDVTRKDAKFDELSVKRHKLLFPPTLGGSECWREGYFSTVGKVELGEENTYPVHYFKFPQGIRDDAMQKVDTPVCGVPVGHAAYPAGLTLLDDIEDRLS